MTVSSSPSTFEYNSINAKSFPEPFSCLFQYLMIFPISRQQEDRVTIIIKGFEHLTFEESLRDL